MQLEFLNFGVFARVRIRLRAVLPAAVALGLLAAGSAHATDPVVNVNLTCNPNLTLNFSATAFDPDGDLISLTGEVEDYGISFTACTLGLDPVSTELGISETSRGVAGLGAATSGPCNLGNAYRGVAAAEDALGGSDTAVSPCCVCFTSSGPGSIGPSLRLDRSSLSFLSLSWEASSCGGASDYGIYQGLIGDWASYTMVDCHDDDGDLVEELTVSADDCYYFVVPNNGEAEGSYGSGIGGGERPAAAAACLPSQDLRCP